MRLIRLNFCDLRDRHFPAAVVCIAIFASFSMPALCVTDSSIHNSTGRTPGIAWNVVGSWHIEGLREPILTGDAIEPGSLLEPGVEDSGHSITVLLADGQQILYECFTAKDCARGFRVPEFEGEPSTFAVQLIERIRAVLVQQREQPQLVLDTHSAAGRDEAAAVLGADNRIEISGLAASLSDGRYVYDLTPIHSGYSPAKSVPLQKSGRSIALRVPGPGLYRLMIVDSLGNPRIDYLIAAVRPGEGDKIVAYFQKAHALFREWVEGFQGWPTHDFQRAWLEALMLDIRPAANGMRMPPANLRVEPDATAEPVFSPKPGMSNGKIEITLRSATPGATIHYTVDSSQPTDSSPVLRSPIVTKGIPIRIKAYAESPGKKDSAVVTAFYGVDNP